LIFTKTAAFALYTVHFKNHNNKKSHFQQKSYFALATFQDTAYLLFLDAEQ